VAAVPSIGRADRAAPEADLTRALYERYSAQIFRYCLHQLGSREEAEDAVQSTFLNAFRGIKRGIVPELESAWLFKIAENVCLSRRRSTWRRNRIESTADFEVVEELAPAPSRLADELVGLQDVLAQMPESQRRAILLREWQGLSYREIAAELDLSQTAVETLIFRARRSLAKGLAEPSAPAEKRRMVRGADLGSLLTGLKSVLFGGAAAAAKTAALVAVVGTVAVAAPEAHHSRSHVPAATPRASTPAPSLRAKVESVRPAPVVVPRPTPAVRKHTTKHVSRPVAAAPPVVASEKAAPAAAGEDSAAPSPAAASARGQKSSAHGHGAGKSQKSAGKGGGVTGGAQSEDRSGQPSSGDKAQAKGSPGQGQGQGQAGHEVEGSSDSAPPPAQASSSGGNGGNGQGNDRTGAAAAGHGH
jgi:RNA polymerase sigma factor (sigma-70 family)